MAILKTVTYQYVTNRLKEKFVFSDKNIQRPGENWDIDMKRDCLRSYCLNRIAASLVLADIRSCLEWTSDNDKLNEYSIKYYTNLLKRGFKYVSLDGNHKRRDVLISFYNNEWTYTGYLIDVYGKKQDFVNVFFKDLPVSYQTRLLSTPVPIMIHDDVSAQELSDIFINLQKGMPLNAQQKRRAEMTLLTPWVRRLSKQNSALWERFGFGSKGGLPFCSDEEAMAKFLIATVTKWGPPMSDIKPATVGLRASDLDNLYSTGVSGSADMFDEDSPYIKEQFERFENIFDKFAAFITMVDRERFTNNKGNIISSTKLKSSHAWMFWWAIEYVHDNNLTVSDYTKFYDTVVSYINKLKVDSHSNYAKAVTSAKAGVTIQESAYFHRCLELPHQPTQRNLAKQEFIKYFSDSKRLKRTTAQQIQQSFAETA